MAPGRRVVEAHGPSAVCFLGQCGKYMDLPTRIRLEVVPFVRADPVVGESTSRRVDSVRNRDRCGLDCRVVLKISPDELAVPGRRVFGVACRMHTDESSSRADVVLECCLLAVIQDIAGR